MGLMFLTEQAEFGLRFINKRKQYFLPLRAAVRAYVLRRLRERGGGLNSRKDAVWRGFLPVIGTVDCENILGKPTN